MIPRRLSAIAALTATFASAVAAAAPATLTAAPVPKDEQQRIGALFGSRSYLPTWLPPGYIFSIWVDQRATTNAYGDILVVDFGKHGDRLQWTVGDGRDTDGYQGDACTTHPYDATVFRFGTRRVVFQSGNDGADATLCLQGQAITLWNAHALSPRTQARIVASARLYG